MADLRDVESTKMLRREFTKRQVDLGYADLRVSHGVAYIRGSLSLVRGTSGDIHSIVANVVHSLRAKPEFRDVVVDAIMK
jgi:hypothetical protein